MTRFRIGDRVEFDGRRGEVIKAWLCGFTGQIVCVVFADGSVRWIMANELTPIGISHARTPFVPKIAGGTDYSSILNIEVTP